LGAVVVALVLISLPHVQAKELLFQAAAAEEDAELNKGEDLAEEQFPNGAALKTDPELERLLIRAEQFAADGRFDLASVLWQKVLDESGDTLMTRDGVVYTSLAAEVERTLARLPREGLDLYRISADGAAHAILGSISSSGVDEEEALNKIVRRYFLSSLGDDAAYKLGCLALDRHDFVGASRMFQAILDQHPDPSIPRADVLLRMAVAAAKVGDMNAAQQCLTEIETVAGPRPAREAIASVRRYLTSPDLAAVAVEGGNRWTMDLGNPRRTGHMPALALKSVSADLAELWTQEFPVLLPQAQTDPRLAGSVRPGVMIAAGGGIIMRSSIVRNAPQMTSPDTRESLVQSWKNKGYFPTSRLLFESDEQGARVFVKSATELLCFDASSQSDQPLWRSAWMNLYLPDAGTLTMSQMRINGYQLGSDGPQTIAEILHFGDRVHQSISMSGGLIYNIEGQRVHGSNAEIDADPTLTKPFQWGTVPRRSRRNWLAAYETHTGKAVWYRSADDSEAAQADPTKGSTDIGFVAAPTPYGNLLLVPVTDGGTMWLYALSQQDGKTVWKTYLCDEPSGGASQWATVGLAVDGREAYVCCGAGAVFTIDAVSGLIRWAVRYKRDGVPDPKFRNIYGMQNASLALTGWQDDVVIPYGKLLLVMPSDRDELFALDRRSGELAWNSPRTSPIDGRVALYPVGVVGRSLYVAGRDVVRKYDIPSGRLVAERAINADSRQSDALAYGRGCVTENALHLPVKDSVLTLSLDDLSDIAQVGVSTVSGDYVGNLFSDGDKLWVSGASKVYALTNYERRMAELARRIEAGDAEAQLIRMRMRYTLGHIDEAVTDLEGAYANAAAKDRLAAAELMVSGLKELQLPSTQPVKTCELIQRAFMAPESSTLVDLTQGHAELAPRAADVAQQRTQLLYSLLAHIRNKDIKHTAGPLLSLAPCYAEQYLHHAARKTLGAIATKDDLEVLAAAVESGDRARIELAADAFAILGQEAAKNPLAKLLESDDENIRLAAATGLLNQGDKAALPVLVALLESPTDAIASSASSTLRQSTQKVIPFSPRDAEVRKTGVEQWKAWLASDAAAAELRYPLPSGGVLLGRTLICYYAQGKVVELDSDNKERWSQAVQGVWSGQGLPNGHRLFALYALRKLVEYDEKGNVVWEVTGIPGSPYHVQRLENGNTLVACSDAQKVVEYNPEKEIVWSADLQGRPMDAIKLENGNLLVAMQQGNSVIEYAVNAKGIEKEVWKAEGLNGAMRVQRLENGNTLVACMQGGSKGTGQVVELTPDKKQIWTFDDVRNPYDCQRLPNGSTLITDQTQVLEVEANKNIRFRQQQQGSSSAHRF
jgi:outer membrane protein assembly factor BamB